MLGMEVNRDGRTWRIGTAEDVDWIGRATTIDRTITSAIPPIFAAYATFHEPDGIDTTDHEQAVVAHLTEVCGDQPWWLGFLDTGAHDIVFDNVPKVTLYSDWHYVLVQAAAGNALSLRTGHMRAGDGTLPDLLFPADRSWLVSGLWDDTWTCIGGPAELVAKLQDDPLVRARVVGIGDEVTPPGHSIF